MSPAAKPRISENKFLVRKKRPANAKPAGPNELSQGGGIRPRLPDELGERLKDIAWKRRITLQALVIEILENATAS